MSIISCAEFYGDLSEGGLPEPLKTVYSMGHYDLMPLTSEPFYALFL